ncbi:MAG: hypothetical protein ACK45H_15200 [Bacteroidota bacterium]|jgi:hypothetical protein
MKTYLVFFGSSDGFEFEAFDIASGDRDSFKTRFKNFDQLDPKFIISDNYNNPTVFGKYRVSFNGVPLSVIKAYQCAQSNVSSRVEGSNIGVALVSERDLAFIPENINLIKELLKAFTEEALNESGSNGDFKARKFKEKRFTSESQVLFDRYKNNLNKIHFDPQPISLSNLSGNAVFVTREIDETKLRKINELSNRYSRFYLCSDLAHAERSLQAKTFLLFVDHKNEFLTHKGYLDAIKPPKPQPEPPKGGGVPGTGIPKPIPGNGSRDLEHEIRILEERIGKANKHIQKLNGSIKTLRYSIVACLLFFFGSWSYIYFFSEEDEVVSNEKIITEQIEVNPLKDILVKKDTISIGALANFLSKYNSLIKTDKEPDTLWKDSSNIELNKKLRLK